MPAGSEVAKLDESNSKPNSKLLSASGKFAASRGLTPNVQFSPDLTTLHSPGFVVDRVSRVDGVHGPIVTEGYHIEEIKQTCANRIIQPPDLAAKYAYTQATMGSTLESAIVAGIQSGFGKPNPHSVEKTLGGVLPNKSYNLFVTECGYIGSSHLQIRGGDIIVVLQGSATPAALRREKEGWIYVGICYGAFKATLH